MTPAFILYGKRVNLRTMVASDRVNYERWDDPGLKVWDFDGPWHGQRRVSPDSVIRRLEDNLQPPYRSLEVETTDGIHLGFVILHYLENDPHIPEIGIRFFDDAFWDRGLGTEALSLWIDYLFREWSFTRIGFSTWGGNPRVIAIGHKLGFVQEACIRRGCEVDGRFYDRIKMGLLREEWGTKAL